MSPPTTCHSCDTPLETDGACLVCLLSDALTAEKHHRKEGTGSRDGGPASPSGFGHFTHPEAGMFGKYILRQKLGQGGMGIVWEAEDTTLQRVVALKMIRGFAFSADSEKQRFEAEATAIAQLDHPNIVPIYEVGEIEGQPFFAMKLLDGGSLSQRLQDGALEPRSAATIMEKLARAIHHAHGRRVLHRDLKPDNVLFDEAGEPYLTDFGLAKMLDSTEGLTLGHAQIGTPQYMSPEQARGRANDITAASDVWAAGALLYHMLMGHVPFPGSSSGEIFDHIANTQPPAMQGSKTRVDKDLETLCKRCLEKDPARRLGSAEILADELGRWLRGEPIHARSTTRVERALLWVRRQLGHTTIAGLLAFALIALIALMLTWPVSQQPRTVVNIGDAIGLQNVANEEYLDTCGIVKYTPFGFLLPTQYLLVFTSKLLNRDGLSGTWAIVSAEGKLKGSPLCYGDVVLLRNQFPEAGWLDNGGLVNQLAEHSEGYANFVSTQQTAVSTSRKRQADRTDQWLVLDKNGQPSGEPVELQDQILLKSKSGEEGGYLNAMGEVNNIPGFREPAPDVSSLVFVGFPAEPREEDLWRMVQIQK